MSKIQTQTEDRRVGRGREGHLVQPLAGQGSVAQHGTRTRDPESAGLLLHRLSCGAEGTVVPSPWWRVRGSHVDCTPRKRRWAWENVAHESSLVNLPSFAR